MASTLLPPGPSDCGLPLSSSNPLADQDGDISRRIVDYGLGSDATVHARGPPIHGVDANAGIQRTCRAGDRHDLESTLSGPLVRLQAEPPAQAGPLLGCHQRARKDAIAVVAVRLLENPAVFAVPGDIPGRAGLRQEALPGGHRDPELVPQQGQALAFT